jgi:hypothetical protein
MDQYVDGKIQRIFFKQLTIIKHGKRKVSQLVRTNYQMVLADLVPKCEIKSLP